MKSVKGMTWGIPEFVALAKKAEAEAEAKYVMETALDSVEKNDCIDKVSYEVFENCRQQAKYLFELFDETEV